MKLIPKYQTAWGKLKYSEPSDNTRVSPILVPDTKILGKVPIVGTQAQFTQDNRTDLQKENDIERSNKLSEEYLQAKDAEKALRDLSGFLTVTDAATIGTGIGSLVNKGVKVGVNNLLRNNLVRSKVISKEMNNSLKTPTIESFLPSKQIEYVSPKSNVTKTYLGLYERPSKTTLSENLGLTKGERLGNNLPRTERDAVRDFSDYYTSGRNKKYFIFKDGEYRWVDKPDNTAEGAVTHMLNTNGSSVTGFIRAPYQEGVISKSLNDNLISYSSGFPSEWGVASNNAQGRHARNIILTSPKVDFQTSFVPESPEDQIIVLNMLDKLPNTIDKDIVKNYWKTSSQVTQPGLYTSGDAGALPLGANLMIALDKSNRLSEVSKALLLGEAKGLTRGRSGLSTDSYMSILKLGNRPGNSLSFNMEDGFGIFNNSGVYNKHIYDLWELASKGEIPKEEFLEAFRKWVEPYGGRPAFLSKKNKKIIIPHPFVYKRRLGGKI